MHRCAVIHVLTGSAAEVINPLRERFDPVSAEVIGAHLTLAGPFESDLPALDYADRISDVADRFTAFSITLAGFDTFMPVSHTTFARLDAAEDVVAVHDALILGLNWTEGYPYHPHVTITEYLDSADTARVQMMLSQMPLKVMDQVTKLSLLQKAANGVWHLVQEFPLRP